jgi:nuclear pore complex protein Nup62
MPTAPAPAKDDAAKSADAPTAPKPGAASLFGNLGAKPAASSASSAPAVPSLLGGAAATSSTSAVPAPSGAAAPATAKVSAAPEPAPSVVKGKTFNEIVERFEAELEDQVSRFKDQAAEVREWDMILIDNSQNVSTYDCRVGKGLTLAISKIARLYDQMQRAEVERHNIRAALDAIDARQDNLLAQVDEYESVANEVAEGIANNRNIEGGSNRPADLQRQDA